MKHVRLVALGAISMLFASAVPAAAQNDPFMGGEFVDVTGVTLDDGHYLDYATFLSGYYKAQEEYAISQGWQTNWEILANVYKRKGEPDLYLIRRYKSIPSAAESDKRGQMIRDHVKMTDAQMEAASGDRAKFRHIEGSQLLQVLVPRK
ncbi:hypothetical protein ACFO0A_04105 [Novosphingobium tardum]|jgi:hypothetical protein|uniref:Uncharacterized protein n=1 Tax=Novosphingobium tardum TaxID=1538021 RepID=A0ABV8RLP9_9SPHN